MKHLLQIAYDWAVRSFGQAHMDDTPTRSLRVVEEAIELCQAYGVPREQVYKCVSMVYDRPPGAAYQEIGGVLMTIYLLCAATNRDPEEVFLTELRRVLGKSPKHFSDRNDEKIKLGMAVVPPRSTTRFPPTRSTCSEEENNCEQGEGA